MKDHLKIPRAQLLLQQLAKNPEAISSLLAGEIAMKQDGNLSYCNCFPLVQEHLGDMLQSMGGPNEFEGAEFEYIEVGEHGIPPHVHEKTDSVIVIIGYPDEHVGFDAFHDCQPNRWRPAVGQQVVPARRGITHGFRASGNYNGEVLRLLVASTPPIADGDTIPVREAIATD